MAAKARVVIVGGGISGVATAYYLAKKGVRSTVIDSVGICPAASGKAGGFLALDWNDGSPVGPLARTSFALHKEIADALGHSRIDYRRLTCEAVAASDGGAIGQPMAQKKLSGVEWADLGVFASRPMGDASTRASRSRQKCCCLRLSRSHWSVVASPQRQSRRCTRASSPRPCGQRRRSSSARS
jgi:glycine/D-amino acid oxidase-like deaminating enzyme